MRFATAVSFLLATNAPHNRPVITTVSSFLLNSIPNTTTTCAKPPSFAFAPKHHLPFTIASRAPLSTTRGGGDISTMQASTSTEVETETSTKPIEYFRNDYKPSPFLIPKLSMDVQITPDKETVVTSTLTITPNPKSTNDEEGLILDGDSTSVTLFSIEMDGKPLVEGTDYTLTPTHLKIHKPGKTLITKVKIHPESNTQLSGLYKSGGMYCSQCEAMGFRRITYYPDRPDNMAIFEQVRIEAPKKNYPVLLSNGNLIEQGDLDEERHYAIWSDPFPKPSYLFALVAGNLSSIRDTYTTGSGREVHLEIYSEKENVDQLQHAMDSLKTSMKWDEEKFGLEYDLDLYNIVAVNDFNMGAMENKGLNIFNTAYVLTSSQTATDTDYQMVEGVIAHEYFHNWTGNRVTCRDWFQLTLKEGLTVFRDQEFSGDQMDSKSVKRIEDVKTLRGRQFPEDAGPMKHPIRPESYISMDNFYTATVYIKGAEIIRMYQTLLTPAGFRAGMDLYFERHDGSAVTCDDFRNAMSDANDVDLTQFGRWYSTPGTPVVTYESNYSEDDGTLELIFEQSSLSKEGPLHIPIAVGVLDGETGDEIVGTTVLELKEEKQTFTFEGLKAKKVVPSLLRDFSAPVKLKSSSASSSIEEENWSYLAAHDTDGFNKWEAGQKLYTRAIFKSLEDDEGVDDTMKLVEKAFGNTLNGNSNEYSITAYALSLPSESTLAEEMEIIDPVGIHQARKTVKTHLARTFQSDIQSLYDSLTQSMELQKDGDDAEYSIDATSIGKRRLRNVLLDYLSSICDSDDETQTAAKRAMTHFETASGMTDKVAALNALSSMTTANERTIALEKFYDDAKGNPLVINKWFTVQALADTKDVLSNVKELTNHPDFTLTNPNRCRSLVGAFAMNDVHFHREDGKGYEFLGELVADIDEINPQLSSRVARSLVQWRRYDEKRGEMMKAVLEKLKEKKGISDDLYEIVERGLQ